MSEKTPIAIQKVIQEDVKTAVFSALEKIDAKKLFTREGMKVLIKPNILNDKPPERAVCTHPEVIRSVIQWVKQFKPSKITVAESSGGAKLGFTEKAMKGSTILDMCATEEVDCIPFEKTERQIFTVKDPYQLTDFPSSKLLSESDIIINIPKIKTHGQCTLTCCIKNMFGTVLLTNKAKTHARFPTTEKFMQSLVDIYSVSNPQLTVVDGYTCQEGNGPAGGDVVKLDLILAGYDPVALERVVCEIIGLNPELVKYIGFAEKKGLGTSDLNKINIIGEKIENVKRVFKLPKSKPTSVPLPKWLAEYMGKTIFRAEVKFNKNKCKLCNTCWTNCPVEAISPPAEMKPGNIPKWNKKKCITCFCCAELCPHEAVEFKINFVKNFLLSGAGIVFIGIILLIILLAL